MIAAERLLLASALEDPSNQRFVLLSDRLVSLFYLWLEDLIDVEVKPLVFTLLWCSCVPLYDFGYIYRYLVSSPKSFVDSFLDKDNRYTMKMFPVIRKEKWRKGSQVCFLSYLISGIEKRNFLILLLKWTFADCFLCKILEVWVVLKNKLHRQWQNFYCSFVNQFLFVAVDIIDQKPCRGHC
jgi:hypothetical protein